jgi:carbamate kinase
MKEIIMTKKLAIIAVGGNSLIKDEKRQSVQDQYDCVVETVEHISKLIELDYNVVVTHGNGPQVGFILRRSELSAHELHMVPLDSCGADTQGAIGYQIQKALHNKFNEMKIKKNAVTVVTQVLVDKDDESFKKPSKPIGSFMSKEVADERVKNDKWNVVEDSGRGYRRVVASPVPKKIVELDAIKSLLEKDFVVVAVGGGGIPVIEKDGKLEGTAAVIDKDLASSLLASELKADVLIISTAVEKVCLNFGQPNQIELQNVTLAEIEKYMEEGHFKPGSMLPKIKAAVKYLKNGGKKVIITDPEHLYAAIKGETGTHIE